MAEAVALMLEEQDIASRYGSGASSPQEQHIPQLASSARRRFSRSSRPRDFATFGSSPAGSSGGKEAGRWGASRLYMHDEAPLELTFNKHVRSGYRAGLSPGNILSHLLPLLAIVAALLTGWLQWWPGNPREFMVTLVPIMLCLTGSVVYHTFMANHHRYHIWISLDVCSIFILFLFSFFYPMWWGLSCHTNLRLLFAVSYYLAAGAAVLASLRAKSRVGRALPMAALFVVRLAVTGTRFALGAGSHQATWHYLYMEILSAIGGVLNTLRIPECYLPVKTGKPGLFDYLFNSHQLMHMLVVASMCYLVCGATLDHGHYNRGIGCGIKMVA